MPTKTESAVEASRPTESEVESPAAVDTELSQRIETLKRGLGDVLEEVQGILALLHGDDADKK